ncbi:MAG: ATP-grasp domain-containing protein [Candidatus Thiodiazotropha weberae]|nr:ATP-grasp domain-containing protein [Candidatus Thiodiazotropha lotti]MCG8012445.1 ATP-grasp domain-containing protein [Candidatus Thiodiazotropha lotti]MCW4211915.1 ATP-grasp domain-containing protein [Candidatus Thiodiazotropha lotti]MCW4215890.1 ATP-grasp domain-containing protein [Candidatus Thiodiazotropha lotti]
MKKKCVLFKSKERFDEFYKKLALYDIETKVLDFDSLDWIDYDYSTVDYVIYYPSFEFTSNHPNALQRVIDNLKYIHSINNNLVIFPEPKILDYYNDKYRQFLFLNKNNYHIPKTIPLLSKQALEKASEELGYPMVVKNRYGAGGGYVFKVENYKQLEALYELSMLNYSSLDGVKQVLKDLTNKEFYYRWLKAKKLTYPFLSKPLLAQKFVKIEKDLKTVCVNNKVVEGHWRRQANPEMWKMNIDDGGVGEWSYIPESAILESEKLASALGAKWLNIDLIISGENYYISEFSPVWHHYLYKEKDSFVYKDDYNIDMPLQDSLDLSKIIIESFHTTANNV